MKERSIVSGSDGPSIDRQQTLELKTPKKVKRDSGMCSCRDETPFESFQTVFHRTETTPPSDMVSLVTTIEVFTKLGIQFQGEKKDREAVKEAVGKHVQLL